MLYNHKLTNVYTDVNLTIEGEPYQVKRTWKERLFTLPWKPWRSTKWITPRIPSPSIYGFGNNMFMHPVLLEKLKKVMSDELA